MREPSGLWFFLFLYLPEEASGSWGAQSCCFVGCASWLMPLLLCSLKCGIMRKCSCLFFLVCLCVWAPTLWAKSQCYITWALSSNLWYRPSEHDKYSTRHLVGKYIWGKNSARTRAWINSSGFWRFSLEAFLVFSTLLFLVGWLFSFLPDSELCVCPWMKHASKTHLQAWSWQDVPHCSGSPTSSLPFCQCVLMSVPLTLCCMLPSPSLETIMTSSVDFLCRDSFQWQIWSITSLHFLFYWWPLTVWI